MFKKILIPLLIAASFVGNANAVSYSTRHGKLLSIKMTICGDGSIKTRAAIVSPTVHGISNIKAIVNEFAGIPITDGEAQHYFGSENAGDINPVCGDGDGSGPPVEPGDGSYNANIQYGHELASISVSGVNMSCDSSGRMTLKGNSGDTWNRAYNSALHMFSFYSTPTVTGTPILSLSAGLNFGYVNGFDKKTNAPVPNCNAIIQNTKLIDIFFDGP